MAKTVLIQTAVAATNIDSLNRIFLDTASDHENGSVFQCGALSTVAGKGNCFTPTAVADGAGLQNLYMACEPEVVTTVSGDFKAKGIDADPRNFTNIAGVPFTAFKPQVGDIIQITVDGLDGAYVVGNSKPYAVATNGSDSLTWAAAAISGLTFKYLATVPMIIANGSVGSNAVTAYLLECVAIA